MAVNVIRTLAQLEEFYAAQKKRLTLERQLKRSRAVRFLAKGSRRTVKSRFVGAAREAMENFLESRLGPAPSHSDWMSLAEKYTDDFAEHLRDAEEQAEFEDEDF